MNDQTPLRRAKRPRTILAGPYGHPFHPILITVPLGTWIASLVFDVIGLFTADPEPFTVGAQALIAIGLVGAVAAAVFGFLDLSVLAPGTVSRKTALVHMTLNLIAMAVFAASLAVRWVSDHDEVSILGLVLSAVGLALISASGYLGGKLAYRYGVRVADESTQMEGFAGARRRGR